MRLYSDDAIYVRAAPETILHTLTRLSEDATWWPSARTSGAYGWVAASVRAGPFERVRFRADIGPVREWEGVSWQITAGDVTGRAEWWLAEHGDGVVLHHLLDGERGDRRRSLTATGAHRRYRWAIRRGMNALKDHLERPGGPQGSAPDGRLR